MFKSIKELFTLSQPPSEEKTEAPFIEVGGKDLDVSEPIHTLAKLVETNMNRFKTSHTKGDVNVIDVVDNVTGIRGRVLLSAFNRNVRYESKWSPYFKTLHQHMKDTLTWQVQWGGLTLTQDEVLLIKGSYIRQRDSRIAKVDKWYDDKQTLRKSRENLMQDEIRKELCKVYCK